MNWALFVILGYLCGSIPFGLLLTRAAGLGDVRTIGSGNIGATNVLRTGNKKIAALTLICDGLKGFIPVFIASYFSRDAMIAAGLASFLGHIFPAWLGFKGGKGVATGLGVMFGWSWILGLAFCAIWLTMFLTTKISSLSALSASALLIVVAIALQTTSYAVTIWPIVLAVAIIWITHRENIARLFAGEEKPSSFSK